jgi:sugar lactone lactonase YvrE
LAPCPRSVSTAKTPISYNPAQIAQGETWAQIYAVDPVGHWSNVGESRIKVDRRAPELGLSGALTEQGALGSKLRNYALTYTAKDGDETAASALTPYGTVGTGIGQLEGPSGVAVDSSGNVWTADSTNNRLLEYSAAGKFLREVKTAGVTALNGPRGVAIAPNGTIWVVDSGNKRLVALSPEGTFVREVTRLSSDNEPENPYAVAVAQDGSVWVSDTVAHKIRHISETGTFLGNAPDSPKAAVYGLATDSFGNLWATEYVSNKVYEFDSSGHFKFSFGGEGTGSGQFKGILSLAIAPSGNLFVVDSSNNRIQELRPDGSFIRAFGAEGSANNQFKEPRGVAVGPGNTLYVGDAGNHRLARWQDADKHIESGAAKIEIKVDGALKETKNPGCSTKNCSITGGWTMDAQSYSDGKHTVEVVATDAVGNKSTKTVPIEIHPTPPALALSGTLTEQATLGNTRPGYTLDAEASPSGSYGGLPTFISAFGTTGSGIGQLNGPRGVASDGKGHVWVVDRANNRVEEFNESGEYLFRFGSTGAGDGQFNNPFGITVTAAGNLWVADSGNARLQEFNSKGEFLQKFGTKTSTGSQGTEFSEPTRLAAGPNGMLWVADTTGNRVAEFRESVVSESERFVRNAAGAPIVRPSGAAIDGAGNLWILEESANHLVEFNSEGSFIRSVGSTGTGNGQFNAPQGVSVGSTGTIYVVDQGSNRIEVFNAQGEYLSKFGTAGTGDGNFTEAKAVAFGAGGSIFVTDKGNNRVQKWGAPWEGPPTFISAFGATGSAAGQLNGPRAVAADGKGHVWVVDRANNRVEQFNESGEFISQFGSTGAGDGQFNEPFGITVTSAGNLWVADTGNRRLQEFNAKGEFMQKFGTKTTTGSQSTEFVEPFQVAAAPGGMLWVTDTPGNRIAEFRENVASESERFVRNATGATTSRPTGVAVDGSGNVWVADENTSHLTEFNSAGSFLRSVGSSGAANGQLNAPQGVGVSPTGTVYVVDQGNNRVEAFNSTGEFLTKFGTAGTSSSNFTEPKGIAFGAGGAMFVTDKGNNRVHKWVQAEAPDPIASIEVTVDGKVVELSPTSCSGSGCTLARRWTLSSLQYLGTHPVVVKATSAAGFTTTKTLNVNEQRDETKPSVQVGGELANASEGWVQQKSYGLTATGTDPVGYGVTSLVFKIDGIVVQSTTQPCGNGGCEIATSKPVNIASYSGGSHAAELVALDGAGNSTTHRWTINVDPKGQITTSEAEATLEALDRTSSANTVGPSEAEAEYEGTSPELKLEPGNGVFISTGTAAPSQVDKNVPGEFTIDIPTSAPQVSCASEQNEGGSGALSGSAEEDLATTAQCQSPTFLGAAPTLESVEIVPVASNEGAQVLTEQATAAVAPNVSANTDLVTRPLFDGAQSFAAIRDSSGPTSFSWRVNLEVDQELTLLDPQHAAVYYEEGHPAFSITATPAHDAIGTAVPTTLSIAGNVLTLNVNHHAGSFVYPVVGGAGWEGGFTTYQVVMPPPELPEEKPYIAEGEVQVWGPREGLFRDMEYGPPVFDSNGSDGVPERHRGYNFHQCFWEINGQNPEFEGYSPPPKERALIKAKCHDDNANDNFTIGWAVSVNGSYKYKRGQWALATDGPYCPKWGPREPATVHCRPTSNLKSANLDALGMFRFAPGRYDGGNHSPGQAMCYELDGVLPDWFLVEIPGEQVLFSHFYINRDPVWPDDQCPWGHLDRAT